MSTKPQGADMPFFSSRQVVAIVATVGATLVLMPATVWAASSSLVRLSDGRGHVARIGTKGQLSVAGNVNVQNKVGITGAVVATPALPGKRFHAVVTAAFNQSPPVIFSSSTGAKLYVTSIAVTENTDASTANPDSGVQQVTLLTNPTSGNCTNVAGGALADQIPVETTSLNTVQLTYPTPVVLGAAKGTLACVVATPTLPSGGQAIFEVEGYTA